jgi:hypothetical protein
MNETPEYALRSLRLIREAVLLSHAIKDKARELYDADHRVIGADRKIWESPPYIRYEEAYARSVRRIIRRATDAALDRL